MMKKKHKPEENEEHSVNTETSDNKDNTDTKTEIEQNHEERVLSSDEPKAEAGKPDENAPSTDKIEQELKDNIAKLAEMQDKYLRLSAEFDNYRKRTLREKMDLSKYATEDLLLKIIPLMDDFDRAVQHMEDTAECSAMKSGIELIYGKFNDFLRQNGVREIEALHSDFNVDIHEAVAKVPANDENQKGKVIDVVLKGYYLQDKVIRFSKVVVGE